MNKKTIKITESELRSMIQKSLNESIDEAWYDDSVKNVAKKVGKGIAKGVAGTALAASIGAGGLYALDKGLYLHHSLKSAAIDTMAVAVGREQVQTACLAG